MNRKIVLSLAFVATLFFTSCKKELEPQDSSETPLTESSANPENAEASSIETQPQVQVDPSSVPVQTVQAPAPTTAKTLPGMNPPHGEPGHRCDIAVGAPLNSPKGQTPAPQVAQPTAGSASVQKVTPQVQPQPVATETAPGMNPPHGQPGHRCEIAVGAPLPTE